MAKVGVIFKRCGCVDPASRRQLGNDCPRLPQRGHGSWYFHCSTTDLLGRSERVRRGGFASRAAARRARDAFLARSREQRAGDGWSMERWLRYWLSTRTSIRPTTRLHYSRDIERFLIPFLGQVKLSELTSRRLNAIFAEIGKVSNRFGRPTSACTLQHLRTTLRAALNAAIREGLITDNPARRVELPARRRPHPLVWTEHRVADWQDFGVRPAVAVWTPQQLAVFLDFVRDERLFALWWLVALRGLRRGEAAGLRWSDIDLDRGQLEIVRQRTTAGHQVIECTPKSAASARIVALDKHTVKALRAHAARQRRERDRCLTAGKEWVDSGYVFTRADGTPIHPTYLTQRMRTLVKRAGLPPIRLHDLRHGAASLAHTAGADLKVLQDQLGHASIVMTADIYTSVLPRSQRKAAEATARLVLAAAGRDRKKIKRSGRRSRPVPPRKSAAPGLPAKIGNRETAAHAADHRKAVRHSATAQPRHTHRTGRPYRTNERR